MEKTDTIICLKKKTKTKRIIVRLKSLNTINEIVF